MATHSSILAWKMPRTEEPGGLQSMGSPLHRKESDVTERLTRWELNGGSNEQNLSREMEIGSILLSLL